MAVKLFINYLVKYWEKIIFQFIMQYDCNTWALACVVSEVSINVFYTIWLGNKSGNKNKCDSVCLLLLEGKVHQCPPCLLCSYQHNTFNSRVSELIGVG